MREIIDWVYKTTKSIRKLTNWWSSTSILSISFQSKFTRFCSAYILTVSSRTKHRYKRNLELHKNKAVNDRLSKIWN